MWLYYTTTVFCTPVCSLTDFYFAAQIANIHNDKWLEWHLNIPICYHGDAKACPTSAASQNLVFIPKETSSSLVAWRNLLCQCSDCTPLRDFLISQGMGLKVPGNPHPLIVQGKMYLTVHCFMFVILGYLSFLPKYRNTLNWLVTVFPNNSAHLFPKHPVHCSLTRRSGTS